jgi:hypothetical protein
MWRGRTVLLYRRGSGMTTAAEEVRKQWEADMHDLKNREGKTDE